jgi:hypothetical protein
MRVPVEVVAVEQAWPGRRADLSPVPPRVPVAERFIDWRALVLVVAAIRYASDERFGLGVWLAVNGPTYVAGGLIRPDDRSDVATSLACWCERQSPALSLSTLSGFFDWRTGRFRRDVYSGRAWLVGADIGRALGLVCDWTPARGDRWRDGFTFWPPTWSTLVERKDGRTVRRSVSPNIPPIRVKVAASHGYFVEFGRPPGGPPCGKRNADGTHYRGRFLDVVPAAFGVLDGIDSYRLGDHLAACGVAPVDVPAAVTLDKSGADELLTIAHAIWRLALTLDAEVAG